jgi:predicted glutamine amidotransferase
MCVIAVSLKGVKFSVDDLKKMWDANSHGAGVAWCDGSRVKVRKGFMKFEEFIEFYEEGVPRGVMHAIHFRLRSAGEVVPELTHPFRVDVVDTQELEYVADRVLFHNGTVSDWRGIFWGVLSSFSEEDVKKVFSVKYLSDSYVVSLLVYRYGHEVLKFCDDTSKWLVFSSEPVFYGRWERDDKRGFVFSNLSWRYSLEGFSYRNFWSGWRGRL